MQYQYEVSSQWNQFFSKRLILTSHSTVRHFEKEGELSYYYCDCHEVSMPAGCIAFFSNICFPNAQQRGPTSSAFVCPSANTHTHMANRVHSMYVGFFCVTEWTTPTLLYTQCSQLPLARCGYVPRCGRLKQHYFTFVIPTGTHKSCPTH